VTPAGSPCRRAWARGCSLKTPRNTKNPRRRGNYSPRREIPLNFSFFLLFWGFFWRGEKGGKGARTPGPPLPWELLPGVAPAGCGTPAPRAPASPQPSPSVAPTAPPLRPSDELPRTEHVAGVISGGSRLKRGSAVATEMRAKKKGEAGIDTGVNSFVPILSPCHFAK